MLFRLAGTIQDSIVDGPGYRLAVFMQGCPYNCPGCHNPQTHDPAGGREADTDTLLALFDENPLMSGLTLTGGEPLLQPDAAYALAKGAKEKGKHVMLYSGGRFEQLIQNEANVKVLQQVDVLVDGPFHQDERTLELNFRGSRNQRILDVPASLSAGKPVELNWDV